VENIVRSAAAHLMSTSATCETAIVRILITNVQLDHRTGTEIVVRDLESGLRERGHDVCVYTPRPGILSDEITARGGLVVDTLDLVPFVPDVIHAHHNGPATEAALCFPHTPLVFVCHSRNAHIDMAPGVPSVSQYVAVDLNCRERLVAEGVPVDSIHVISNAVDIGRLVTRGDVSAPLRKAAVFSNQARDGGFVESVRRACASAGLALDEFGMGVGRTLDDPECRLAEYDVVFAKARCAIEALAAGCAVIAVDEAGYGGLVTYADVDWMLDWNVGDRCLQRAHDPVAIEEDLRRIDAEDVGRVSDLVRRRCSLEASLDAYELVYKAAMEGERASLSPSAGSWRDPYDAVVEYATNLETRLRAGEGAWSMPPLPPASAQAISVAAVSAPRLVATGETFAIDLEIVNRSRENLSSTGATPVRLSYHWMDEAGELIHFEGRRTDLTRTVRPWDRHRQRMHVDAPKDAGRLRLRVTLVQETVTWFTSLPTPVFDDVTIMIGEVLDGWTLADIAGFCGLVVLRDAAVANLGFVSSTMPEMLTFAETESFVDTAVRRGCQALIVPPALVPRVPEQIGVIVSDTPSRTFRELHETLAHGTDFYGADVESRIHPGARVHPTASIDTRNVLISDGVEIGAGCVVSGRVTIGRRVQMHPGSVIGAAGFQTMSVDGRLVELVHVGGVVVGDDAVVFANATIARGLFRQDTVIGEGCRVGNNAFVSHNTQLGRNTTVGHGTVVNGNVSVGDEVWIGPGACIANNVTIGDRARIDLGATVIGSLAAGEHVGGPPAIDHRTVLREVATWRSQARR
jgi:UDP-3-O-[3-hydroxymyristoyl] glucosamine N-acyltransferase